jgi:hypothetical protein
MAVIDARFAGGHIEVTTVPLPHDKSQQMVEVIMPANVAQMFPDEARRFAISLLAAAADADAPAMPDWP